MKEYAEAMRGRYSVDLAQLVHHLFGQADQVTLGPLDLIALPVAATLRQRGGC